MAETSKVAEAVTSQTEGFIMETLPPLVEKVALSPNYLATPMDVSDITRILSRPCTLASGVIPVTGNTSVFSTTITASTILAKWSQLSEYYGIRATVVMRLMITATPTDAGLLGFNFDPTIGTNVGGVVRTHMTSAAQLPGRVFNMAIDRDVELRLPWVQPYEFCQLAANPTLAVGGLSWGGINFYTLTPRVSGVDSGDPSYRILMWLEDVSLFGVRGRVIMP
jgi:hypothetical protein